ncbi:sigma-70 family RNA polymerase sigma factor [Chitinophaga sp. 212800010-3]|uniref:RNA polymerase sigma factor n=1 Tax=unclassified Chitinophaga TaxID=2619133 RepID=UPI002DF358D5|nr:hypothetical protein [Chitinophaga sp. 212800010-3]
MYTPRGFSIEALQEGDESMFRMVFHDFYPGLLAFAGSMVEDTCVAEEIVEDVFLKLWQRVARFSSFQSIKAFLYIAVRNGCLDHFRKTKRAQKRYRDLEQHPEPPEEEVLHAMIRVEVLREISHAIEQLPVHYGKVIRLTFDEGMKAGEIAAMTGMPVSTVRNQLSRGLALLRKLLSVHAFEALLLIIGMHQ